eukprot:scaffold241_cov89-Cylindrotheca_fusiformis.AAC.10
MRSSTIRPFQNFSRERKKEKKEDFVFARVWHCHVQGILNGVKPKVMTSFEIRRIPPRNLESGLSILLCCVFQSVVGNPTSVRVIQKDEAFMDEALDFKRRVV